MEGSFREFRQIAQESEHISHDHIVTAFHFLISNRWGTAGVAEAGADGVGFTSAWTGAVSSPDIILI
jgi:hypothetical protein